MFLFNFFNGYAGVWPWLDALARFFYVGAVPLLATALAACLLLAPRSANLPARWRIAAAAVLAVLSCVLMMAAVNGFAASALHTANLSPRPYMTRFVTPLVIEPNDNSFPAPEMMIAAALATTLLAASAPAGAAGWGGVLLLGVARLFCGANYPADVIAGALLGGGLGTLSLSLLQVRLQWPARGGRRWVWRARHQAIFSTAAVAGVLLVSLGAFLSMPRFQGYLHWPRSTSAVAAAHKNDASNGSADASSTDMTGEVAPGSRGFRFVPAGQSLLDADVTHYDGHLPRAEELLRAALQNIGLTHHIVGVNVAAIKAGTSGYRCGAVRFLVTGKGVEERRRVVLTAARVARRCFHADGQLRTLDVLGVTRTPLPGGTTKETVVFSASVQQKDLKLEKAPAWLNWSGVDPGLWLRARSELYFDPQILPAGGGS